MYDYCKTVLLLYVFNNIGVRSLKMAITPKHVAKIYRTVHLLVLVQFVIAVLLSSTA